MRKNIDGRVSALEAKAAPFEPYTIEIVSGGTITAAEADAKDREKKAHPKTLPADGRISRIELVGVLPEAKIIPPRPEV